MFNISFSSDTQHAFEHFELLNLTLRMILYVRLYAAADIATITDERRLHV